MSEVTIKRFGLDSEGSNQAPYVTRTIQVYVPTMGKTMVLHKPPGHLKWKVIWVHSDALMQDIENAASYISRTDRTQSDEEVKAFLTNPIHGFITHNGYYESYSFLRDLSYQPNITGDSWIYGKLMPTGPQYSKSLDNLMKQYVDEDYDKNRWGNWASHQWDVEELSDEALLYCSCDAYASYHIETDLLSNYPRYNDAIYKLELDLLPVLSRMKHEGITVDEQAFALSVYNFRNKVGNLQMELDKAAGWHVRVGSTADVSQLVFEELKQSTPIMTSGGKSKIKKMSTSKEALAYCSHPTVQIVLDLKEAQAILSNLESMWASPMGDRIEQNGVKCRRYHPTFKALSDSQGSRIYTEEPSVNQWTWEMRKGVVPSGGGAFYFADVSAFELLLLAYAGGQEDMIENYLAGLDIHRKEASKVFKIGEDQVTEAKREAIKTVEYATIYGSEGASVARTLRCSLGEATNLCTNFLIVNDRIKGLRDRVHASTRKTGIARTPMGRRRRISEVYSPYESIKEKGDRKAFNTYAQSGAADFIKSALINLDKDLPPEYKLTFTVFDSLLIKVPDMDPRHKEIIDPLVAKHLQFPINGRMWKFLFKSGLGLNWYDAKQASEKTKPVNLSFD